MPSHPSSRVLRRFSEPDVSSPRSSLIVPPTPGVLHHPQPRPRYLNIRLIAEHVFAFETLASSLHLEPCRVMTP
jgi:hypothetical protein